MQAWAMHMSGRKPDRSNRPRVKEGVVLPPGMAMPEVPSPKKE